MVHKHHQANTMMYAVSRGEPLQSGIITTENMIVLSVNGLENLLSKPENLLSFICEVEHELDHLLENRLEYRAMATEERCLIDVGLNSLSFFGQFSVENSQFSPEDRRMLRIMSWYEPRSYVASLLERTDGQINEEFVDRMPGDARNQYQKFIQAVRELRSDATQRYAGLNMSSRDILLGIADFLAYRDTKAGSRDLNNPKYRASFQERVVSFYDQLVTYVELIRDPRRPTATNDGGD